MFGAARTYLSLPLSHKWIFAKISILVPVVEVGLRLFGFKKTFWMISRLIRKSNSPAENPQLLINRHFNYLLLFTKHFPNFGNCLARSLTLWLLLKNSGIDTDLRFGMKKKNELLLAHAWLEYEGTPLAGEEELDEKYSFFPDSILTKLT